jgi:hypothetical protein
MRFCLMPAAVAFALTACLPPDMADARATTLSRAPEGYPIVVAAGSHGRAVTSWGTASGVGLAERSLAGRWSSPVKVSAGDELPAFATMGPGRAVTVLAYDHTGAAERLLALRREAGDGAFGAPEVVAQGPGIQLLSAAGDTRGDVAALVAYHDTFQPHVALVSAARGGAFGAPQPIEAQTGTVAVGGRGRVVVAYWDRDSVYARTATLGKPLGAPQRLAGRPTRRDIAAAVDDAGNATVAFARESEGERDRDKRPALVAARALPNRLFGSPAVVAHAGTAFMGLGFASIVAAGAGTTTALAWDPFESARSGDAGRRLGVAIAHGAGSFGRAQSPSAMDVTTRTQHGSATNPRLAVDSAGDVLLAYSYGNAVHATRRAGGRGRFDAPRVLTRLGHGPIPGDQLLGNLPAIAMLSDRTPLVAYHGPAGGVLVTDRLDGPRPDLTLPRVRVALLPDAADRLRTRNEVGVRISCSHACVAWGRATLRTAAGRTIVGQRDGRGLRARETFTTRFAFDPARRAKTAGDGARLRVTIGAESATGVTSEAVAVLTLGS